MTTNYKKHSALFNTQGGEYHLSADEHNKILILSDLFARKRCSDIVGIELNGNTWRNIDANGNEISNEVVKQSPCLAGIHDVEVDGQSMVEIPKFWFLFDDSNGIQRWWIADHDFVISGVGRAQIHKGFIYRGIVEPAFQIGAYEVSEDPNDSTRSISVAGAAPRTGLSLEDQRQYCKNNGNDFSALNIWQWGAIQTLCLIDNGGPDVQTKIGTGNAGAGLGVFAETGTTDAVWRGIHEMWGNGLEYLDGSDIWANEPRIWDDAGGGTWTKTKVIIPKNRDFLPKLITMHSTPWLTQGLFFPIETSLDINDEAKWGDGRVSYHKRPHHAYSLFTGHLNDESEGHGLFALTVIDMTENYSSIPDTAVCVTTRLSRPVRTSVTENDNDVVGIELNGNTWRNIDANGNEIPNDAVKQSPCLTGIHDVEVDGQSMVEIPKFWFLFDDSNGIQRWWIANHEFTVHRVGKAKVHNSFMHNEVEKPAFQIGKYLAGFEDNKLTSKAGAAVKTGVSAFELSDYAKNRGNNFEVKNVWQWAALQMLCLIDTGHADVQTVYGQGSVNPGVAGSGPAWRGIYDLWGCYLEYTIGIHRSYYTMRIWDDASGFCYPDTDFLALDIPQNKAVISSINTKYAAHGLFLPAAARASTAWGNDCYACSADHGEYWYFTGGSPNVRPLSQCGMFAMQLYSPSSMTYSVIAYRPASFEDIASRLARSVDESEVTA